MEKIEGKKRLYNIDIIRGIAILLVIIGHSGCPDVLHRIIYIFHMPLFFFISGYLFDDNKLKLSIKAYAMKKGKALLLPYALFAVLTFVFYSFLAAVMNTLDGTFIFKQITALVYSNYIYDKNYTGVIWFLTVLYVTEILYFVLRKYSKDNKVLFESAICTIVMIGLIWGKITDIRLPWGCEIAAVALFFYAIGHYVKTHIAIIRANLCMPVGAALVGVGGIRYTKLQNFFYK